MSFFNDPLTPQVTIKGVAPPADNFSDVASPIVQNNLFLNQLVNIYYSTPNGDTNDPRTVYRVIADWLSDYNRVHLGFDNPTVGTKSLTGLTIATFLEDFYNWLGEPVRSGVWGEPSLSALVDAYGGTYQQIINFIAPDGVSNPNSPDASAWAALLQTPGAPTMNQIADDLFRDFLKFYPYQSGTLGPNSAALYPPENDDVAGAFRDAAISDFFSAMFNHIALKATLNTTLTTPTTAVTTTTGSGNVVSFYQAYTNLGFNPANFNARLQQFFLEQTTEEENGLQHDGVFFPSLNFSKWQEEILSERNQAIKDDLKDALDGVPEVFGKVTVDTDPEKKLLVIDDILILLIKMINIIYRVSAAQSETLQFYSLWQEKYTNLIQRIPVLLSNGNPIAGGDSNSGQVRGRQEVQSFNQGLNEHIQSRRSALQDNAKSLQANINQSQDAANQQANIATSILQDLSSILSAIYR